jgi:ADP-heptose:LPS heptosyltransferase
MSCNCPDPELCKKLNKHINGRLWDIWNNKVLTPEKCAKYRQSLSGGQIETKKLRLKHHLAAGDCLVMTAALESLHRTYPNEYITDVDVSVPGCFEHNPWVTKLDKSDDVREITMHYPISDSDKRPIHFMEGFCEYLGQQLDRPLKCVVNHPMIYLGKEEKKWISAVQEHTNFKGRFWLINAGIRKNCYEVKKWKHSYFQEVVDYFHGKIQFVQIGELHHIHKPLKNVINFIGKWDGDARALIRLASHAEGALSPESFLGHIMAAFQKPAVVLASGLFPVGWISYPTSKIISYQASMSCCQGNGACWKSRIFPKDEKDTSLCLLPVLDDDPRGRCMDMITPSEVIKAIESFYLGGICKY